MRYFDRFASEIKRFFCVRQTFDKGGEYYFVSLGCGPGSELYGIVDGLRSQLGNDFKLKYRGYDTNPIWNQVQNVSKQTFHGTNCDVDFHTCDMISEWQDKETSEVFALVMNYLLSDCQKYQSSSDLIQLLDSIVDFIFQHRVKYVVFNDINYVGYGSLDSGVKCMDCILKKIEPKVKRVQSIKVCYSNDNYIPAGWRTWMQNDLLMDTDDTKTQIAQPWKMCKSKYIIARIEY